MWLHLDRSSSKSSSTLHERWHEGRCLSLLFLLHPGERPVLTSQVSMRSLYGMVSNGQQVPKKCIHPPPPVSSFSRRLGCWRITSQRGRLEKNTQRESCKLSLIRGKMRTLAQETASQIALRNCSKEIVGKVIMYVILVKGEYMHSRTYFFLQKVFSRSQGAGITMKNFSAFLDLRRYKNWVHKIGSWKHLSGGLFPQSSRVQGASFLLSALSSS